MKQLHITFSLNLSDRMEEAYHKYPKRFREMVRETILESVGPVPVTDKDMAITSLTVSEANDIR